MIFLWPQYDRKKNIFKLPEGLYFIGDLSYVYKDVSEDGDGIDDEDMFNKNIITELDKVVDSYSDIDTGIYTDILGGDCCCNDQDGYSYGVDSGTIGICRVDEQLVPNIVTGKNDEWWNDLYMMFYKKIIVKVKKEEVNIVKPLGLSHLQQLGRFIYFKEEFNVEFIPLATNDGSTKIKNIKFGHISIDIEQEDDFFDESEEESIESEKESIERDKKMFEEKEEVEIILQSLFEKRLVKDFYEGIIKSNRERNGNDVMWYLCQLVQKYPTKETFFLRGIYQSRLLNDKDWINISNAKKDLIKSFDLDPSWSKAKIELNKIDEKT